MKLFAESKYGGIGNGVSQDQFIQSAESAMCVSILNQLKGNTCAPGVNAVAPHPKDVVYSMGKERGRFTYSMGYDGRGLFNPNEDARGNPLGHEYITLPAVVERLGYIEHKGLGDWKHSHIPSVYDAIMSGEPYQPRVWYERSGNKMVTLADAASWWMRSRRWTSCPIATCTPRRLRSRLPMSCCLQPSGSRWPTIPALTATSRATSCR